MTSSTPIIGAARRIEDSVFEVPRATDLLGGLVARSAPFWRWLGGIETDLLEDRLAEVRIESPIYICGLARAGTTILLELFGALPQVATHRYRDFPLIYTPYFWGLVLSCLARSSTEPVERTHLDGIMVTPESPEAFEEVLWMHFFPNSHDPTRSSVLDADTSHRAFEAFYRDHLRKLMLIQGASRYAAKGNYNIARLAYLLKLLPDARFLIAVREPSAHIASLMKQHALFCEGERRNPRMLAHMRRVGHFEFGLDRRPIHLGPETAPETAEVSALWDAGEELRGWAVYWRAIHGFLLDQIENDEALSRAVHLVRHEALCERPRETLDALARHCRLDPQDPIITDFAQRLHYPSYYRPGFGDAERRLIAEETGETAIRLGYDVS
jgi:hypothetical protein